MKSYILYISFLITLSTADNIIDVDWDYLIFVERWPITVCIEWHDKNVKNNCTIPVNNVQWTIHGIWPTKIGTDGPSFCNKAWPFNETKIEKIEDELKQYWTNIEENTGLISLWKHEWLKHGTCAATLNLLDNEYKYFNQGLDWVKKYSVGEILKRKGIVPNNTGYTIQEINDVLTQELNTTVIIQCVVQAHTKISLISEIRMCFDKSLNLIGCDFDTLKYLFTDNMMYNYESSGIFTNCNLKKPVMYLDSIPRELQDKYDQVDNLEKLITLYRVIKFLIWYTL
nr:ribonuclease Oy [Onthophagus taurus]